MSESVWTVIQAFNYLVLAYFVVLHSIYLATSLFAFGALKRYALRLKSLDLGDLITSASAPPITLLAPAYNEEATVVESVRSLLTLEYPDYEIIVVNDGSKDDTLARLKEAFNLHEAHRVPTAELELQRRPLAPERRVAQRALGLADGLTHALGGGGVAVEEARDGELAVPDREKDSTKRAHSRDFGGGCEAEEN